MADGISALNPLSYWTFPETAGTLSINNMGGTRATLAGGALFSASGAQGRGVVLDGVNDLVSVSHSAAYAMNAGAMSLFFKPDALGRDQGLISKNSAGLDAGGGFTVLLKADGTLHFQLESTTATFTIASSAVASAGTWNNVTITWGAGGMQLWLNGAMVGSNSYTGGLGTSSGGTGADDPLIFGASTANAADLAVNGATDFFKGGLDEAVVMSRQPTAAEIQAIWLNGSVAGNANPVAAADALGVLENGVNPFVGNVLINDTDANGEPLSVFAVRGDTTRVGTAITGTYGVLTLNADGSYAYVLNSSQTNVQALRAGQTLTETFAYTASDGRGGLSTANLVVTINGQNDAPVVVSETRTILEDPTTATLTGNVLTNDRDLDGGVLSVAAVNGASGGVGTAVAGVYGSITIGANGAYTYALANASAAVQGLKASQVVTDVFTYLVSDGQGGQTQAAVTVTITGRNDIPTVVADTGAVNAATGPSTSGNVLTNDTDIDGNTLVVSAVTGSAARVGVDVSGLYGVLRLNADGSYTYALNPASTALIALAPGATATETFAYRASDGAGGTANSSIAFTITGANDAPRAVNDVRTIQEDAASATTAAANVLTNDSDPDGGVLSVTAVNGNAAGVGAAVSGTYGTITIAATGAYTYTLNNASPLVQALKVGQSVTDTFSYSVSDGQGGISTASVVVTVTGRNDGPTVVSETNVIVSGAPAVVGNVLANDSDIEGDAISVSAVRNLAGNVGVPVNGTYGTLVLNADGSYTYSVNPALTAVINLAPGATAIDSFTYTVRDVNGLAGPLGTLAITVVGTNDGPRAVNDARTIQEDAAVLTTSGTALSNDSDPDGGILSVVSVNGDTANVGEPVSGTYGSLTMGDNGAYTYALNNASAAVQELRVGQSVTDTFSYTISDGQGGNATASVVVTVTGRNDVPTVVAQATGTTTEDIATVTSGSILGSLTDRDAGDTLTVNQVRGLATSVGVAVNGTYGVLILNSDGTYTYTLNNAAANVQALTHGQTVTDSFTFRANDSAGANVTNTLVITVVGRDENYAPVANADVVSGTEDIAATFDVRTNDTDPDGDALTVTHIGGVTVSTGQSVALAGGHSAALNADGTITVTAAPNHVGDVSFAYTISDGRGGSAGAQATITFAPVNDAPQLITPILDQAAMEDAAFVFTVPAGTFADIDLGDTLTYSGSLANGDPLPSWLTFDALTQTFSGTPADADVGVLSLRVTATDGSNAIASDTFDVAIAGVTSAATITFSNAVRVLGVERVSTTATGEQGNGITAVTAIFSSDGTRVVFASAASNLVPNDTNGFTDVFVKNLVTGEVSLVSTTASGAQSDQNNSPAFAVPTFSPDGNKVAFYSNATNLVPNDTNGFADMFVKDLVTGAITLVSTNAAGVQGNGASIGTPIFSPDGTKLMFTSQATNFSPGDTNNQYDVYIKDLVTGEITLVSTNEAGVAGGGPAFAPGISSSPRFNADGTKVVFESASPLTAPGTDTNNTFDIFVKDLTTGLVTRVSTDGAGGQANSYSFNPTFSPDGTKVMFWSGASNLVTGDLNNAADVFVKDLATGAITLVSADSSGIYGNGFAASAQWSPDGRYVIFSSASSNLVPDDTNAVADVFAKDLVSGTVSRLSITADGVQTNGGSGIPEFSYDGTSISFNSVATNLVPGDTNASTDLFVAKILQPFRGIEDGKIGLPITVAPAESGETVTQVVLSGLPAGSLLSSGASSDGGATWTFSGPPPANLSLTPPANYGGTFALTVTATTSQGATTAVSVATHPIVIAPDATPAVISFGDELTPGPAYSASTTAAGEVGDGWSYFTPAISADGRYVAFLSDAKNLVPNDTNDRTDIFVKNILTGEIVRASTDSSGVQSNGSANNQGSPPTLQPAISADGRYVIFTSNSSNLVPGDVTTTFDVFLKDLQTESILRLSTSATGGNANSSSFEGTMSADGRYVVFHSFANNLVAGDTNGAADIFRYDMQAATLSRISTNAAGGQVTGGNSTIGSISADGRFVAFISAASNLVDNDTNGVADIFVKDTQTGLVTRVSQAADGTQANALSDILSNAISGDGRYVVFRSSASNLVADDTNGVDDVFIKDMLTGEIQRLSVSAEGLQGNGISAWAYISTDGRYVTFDSSANNLVMDDTNGWNDVFVKDRVTGSLTRVSVTSDGAGGNSYSGNGVLSDDGRQVAFFSYAGNLVAGDTNGFPDVFVRNLYRPFEADEGGVVGLPIRLAAAESGETVTQVVLSGLPAGSILSAGTSSDGGATWTFSGPPPANLSLTPPANYNGSFTLNVTATTQQGSDTETAVATRQVTVAAVNDAPVGTVVGALADGLEDVAYVVTSASLLAGFTDADGDTLSVTGLGTSVGTLTSNGNGTWTLTTAANFNGAVTLSYTITDGQGGAQAATRSINLASINDAPSAGPDPIRSVVAGATAAALMLQVPVDPDHTPMIVVDLLPAAGQVQLADGVPVFIGQSMSLAEFAGLLFLPPATPVAGLLFGYHAIDGDGASDAVTVTISAIDNGVPQALTGGIGDDVFQGSQAGDSINPGTGANTTTAGGGDDFITAAFDGQTDVVDGGSDTDTLTLSGGAQAQNVTITGGASLQVDASGTSGVDVTATNIEDLHLTFGDANDAVSVSGDLAQSGLAPNTVEVFLGGGDDTFDGSGQTGTGVRYIVYGEAGADTITGGIADDILEGGAGDDVLTGGAGVDTVNGGDGNDTLVVAEVTSIAGVGRDVFNGGAGVDTLRLTGGQAGPAASISLFNAQVASIERIEFATGGAVFANFVTGQLPALNTATIVGSANADGITFIAVGAGGTYSLAGTAFTFENWDNGQNLGGANFENFVRPADSLVLTPPSAFTTGNFNLTGSSGRDTIFGANSNDVLNGGDGNDILIGRLGVDQLFGGAGDDALVVAGGVVLSSGVLTNFDEDYSLETYDGGEGQDFLTAVGTVNFNGTLTSIEGFAFDTGLDATLNIGWATVDAMPDAVEVIGGGAVTSLLNINVASASVVDLSAWRFANNYWTDGVDRVTVNGSSGNDTITGTLKSDTLIGGTGVDIVNGGDGNDTLVVSTVDGVLGGETLNGGAGVDTLRLTGGQAGPAASISLFNAQVASIERIEFATGGAVFANFVTGQLPALNTATIVGSANADGITFIAVGAGGTYSLAGTAFTFENWDNGQNLGGANFENFVRPADSLVLTPPSAFTTGNFNLTGSSGRDTIFGANSNDVLNGGDGNDILIGRLGVDQLFGGAGDDALVVAGGVVLSSGVLTNFDEDYSLETYDGGEGQDFLTAVGTVNFNGTLTSIEGLAFDNGFDAALNIGWATVDAMPDAVEVIGGGAVTSLLNINVASASVVDLSAWRFANNYWTDGVDRVTVNGSSGNDTITGTLKSDTLIGGEGNDVLSGGAGNDTLEGGGGSDTFVYGAAAEGGDVIVDFVAGMDKIEVSAFGFGGGLVAGGLEANRLVNGTGATQTFGQFLYDSTNGQLSWDADGTGAGVAVLIATLSGAPAITAADFTVVASLPPLIIDLDGNGVNLISGVGFDFDGDGADEVGGWASAGDGFLALDRNSNGVIDGPSEISFVGDYPGATSDLEGLRGFDANGDGVFSAADADFARFSLWRDADSDGETDPGELVSLSDAGVASISLSRSGVASSQAGGDILGYGTVTFSDGSTTVAADTVLHYTEQSPEKRPMPVNEELFAFADGESAPPVAGELRPQPFEVELLSDATFDFSALNPATLPYTGVRGSNQLVDFDSMAQHKLGGQDALSEYTGTVVSDFHTQDMFEDATQGSVDGAAALGVDIFRVV